MINLSKTKLLSILLVIFLFTTGIFIYQWWEAKVGLTKQIDQNQNLMKQLDELQKEIERLKTSIEEITEWKTYKNEEYDYALKYPEGFTIKEESFPSYVPTETGEACRDILAKENEPVRLLSEVGVIPSGETREVVTIRVWNNSNNLSLDEWLDFGTNFLLNHSECNYMDYVEIILGNKSEIHVAGISGIQGFGGCCGACIRQIYLPKENKIYNLDLLGYAGEICDPCCFVIEEEIFNQILSTFRFIK